MDGTEVLGAKVDLKSCCVVTVVVCHPPHVIPLLNQSFLELMSAVCFKYNRVVVVGNFDYWRDAVPWDPPTVMFSEGMEMLGFKQLVEL